MSTVEILIAFSLFILIITAVILVSYGSQSMVLDAELSESALYKAKEGLEIATTENFNSLVEGSSLDGIYTREVRIQSISNFAKELQSKVSWNEGGRNKNVTLTEIVTDWEHAEGGDTCDLFLNDDWKNPSIIKSISDSDLNFITQIDVFDKKIYVTTNSTIALDPDFHIIDISDLSHISVTSINTGPGLEALHVAGNYAYVGNSSINAQLQIIDISDTHNPAVVASLKLPVFSSTLPDDRVSQSIFYSNSRVYIGTDKSGGKEFVIVDVSNPANPFFAGSFEIDNVVNDIYVVGDRAYLATASTKQMRILDVSNPSTIHEVGSVTLAQYLTQSGKSLYPLGGLVYLGRTWGGGSTTNHEFHILDSESEASIGRVKITDSVNDVFIRSNLAFLATRKVNEEFQVWDVRDPSIVSRNSSLSMGADGISLDCEGEAFYFATPNEIKIIEDQTS